MFFFVSFFIFGSSHRCVLYTYIRMFIGVSIYTSKMEDGALGPIFIASKIVLCFISNQF